MIRGATRLLFTVTMCNYLNYENGRRRMLCDLVHGSSWRSSLASLMTPVMPFPRGCPMSFPIHVALDVWFKLVLAPTVTYYVAKSVCSVRSSQADVSRKWGDKRHDMDALGLSNAELDPPPGTNDRRAIHMSRLGLQAHRAKREGDGCIPLNIGWVCS